VPPTGVNAVNISEKYSSFGALKNSKHYPLLQGFFGPIFNQFLYQAHKKVFLAKPIFFWYNLLDFERRLVIPLSQSREAGKECCHEIPRYRVK
jgi:hypothetical protein